LVLEALALLLEFFALVLWNLNAHAHANLLSVRRESRMLVLQLRVIMHMLVTFCMLTTLALLRLLPLNLLKCFHLTWRLAPFALLPSSSTFFLRRAALLLLLLCFLQLCVAVALHCCFGCFTV
jgi:hypothetical protein